mgnify:FL=1
MKKTVQNKRFIDFYFEVWLFYINFAAEILIMKSIGYMPLRRPQHINFF